MKGKRSQKRVNPIPMITTSTETFKPVLKKTGVKKRDTHHHSHSVV